ncbi:hypothetical protein AAE478_007772 [Parahypoxylon ruwenzoriense]
MSTVDNTRRKPGSAGPGRLELFWTILPRIPLIIRIILLHVLKRSENAKYLDLRSDLTISVMRSALDPAQAKTISETQAMTTRDPGVKGRLWVSTVASEVPPEHGIRDALVAAIDAMSDSGVQDAAAAHPLKVPDVVPVEAEWTGYRANATPDSPLPAISEEQKYRELMKECKNATTVLYFHGGAYCLCDPVTHRPLVKKLAKLTGGRVYSVRYRLAPQNPFPAALLDALVSYFTLLYPPPGSLHDAVAPGDIVFAGDSAGGNLSLALLQTILEIRRQGRRIAWFDKEREVPLPAGVTANSPWVDLVQSMPSWITNQKWCYLPRPRPLSDDVPQRAADDIWPTNPPRKHIYIDDAYALHPLGSLHLGRSGVWTDAPPIYICCGWECLTDESKYLVSRLVADGVRVVFEEYQAMPHVFALVVPALAESRRCLDGWAGFIKAACEDPASIEPSYKMVAAKTLREADVDVQTLTPFTEEQVWNLVRQRLAGEKVKL